MPFIYSTSQMDIYAWGFNGFSQLALNDTESQFDSNDVLVPTKRASGQDIAVLWASWCDVVVCLDGRLYQSGLTDMPANAPTLDSLLNNPSSGMPISFFGDHNGVKGTILSSGALLFPASPSSIHPTSRQTTHVAIASNGQTAVCLSPTTSRHASQLLDFPTFADFKTWIQRPSPRISGPARDLGHLEITSLVAGATSFTALSTSGKVHTWGDSRYSRCLGRPSDSASQPHPIPYLSELRIRKIATGGWMSAAISDEGELFVWGQAEPGQEREIDVLKQDSGDMDGDDFVRVVDLMIDGVAAVARDVAVGSGHLVVAAEVVGDEGKRAVFMAGEGECGQLGLGKRHKFKKEMKEVVDFRGKRVVQLVCGGRSSFAVVEK